MQRNQVQSPKGVWMLFVLSCLLHGLSKANSAHKNGGHIIEPEVLDYHTYIILYKDEANDHNAVNCTAPGNVTLPEMESNLLQKWTAPSGVHLMVAPSLGDNPDISDQARQYHIADQSNARSWVELTPEDTLVFHNPDDSISGPYVCQSTADDQVLYQTTVWVHVLNKNVFDVTERIKVAVITTVIFLGFIVACWGINYWCQRNRMRYTLAKRHEDPINIPTIQVVGASDEKI